MESKFVIVELLIFVARVEPGIQALAGFFQYFDTEQVQSRRCSNMKYNIISDNQCILSWTGICNHQSVIVSSLVVDTLWYFNNHSVEFFCHTNLTRASLGGKMVLDCSCTWHPRRDSSVSPKARSNMSNSSSVASSSILAKSSCK